MTDKLNAIKKELVPDYDEVIVNNFLGYLKTASSETKSNSTNLKHPYLNKINASKYVQMFRKVASMGLYIDGETITIGWTAGKPTITYSYQAFMNRIKASYPDTKFDFQLVREGDDFTFKKDSGRVSYLHKFGNPFDTKKNIIGAYGVIKNEKGHFIEFLNLDDIKKIRATARTDYIWAKWLDRMILKSVIKRICKVHFYDITSTLDKHDNEENHSLATIEETEAKEARKRVVDWIEGAESISLLKECEKDVIDSKDEELMMKYELKHDSLIDKELAVQEEKRDA